MKTVKKLTALLLSMILISAAFVSCSDQTKTDGTATDADVTASESETNATQEQEIENGDAEKEDTDFEYVLLSNETYAIKKLLNTAATEITVPEAYKGKPVTKIMSKAFEKASALTAVTVKSNVQEIEKGAFSGCSSLNNLTLPFVGAKQSSAEPLGYLFGTTAYSGAQKVEQHVTSNGQTKAHTFYIPSGLEKVTVSGGTIRMYAFMGCATVKELVLEDGVTAIESGAFLLCEGLESVSMGKSITEISDECFMNLTGLKQVLIGENVTKIGCYAFDGCTALKSIVIPKKVTVIEKYAFDGCTGMESIIFECTTGWYRDYGSASGTGMNVTDPALNVKNLTDRREYSSDRWKRK